MNKKQLSYLANFLFAVFFVMQLMAYFLYTPCNTYAELIEKNGYVFQIDKVSWFALVLGVFLVLQGSNKSVFRIIFVSVTYSTINELTGLNNYLSIAEYPIFWGVVLLTAIYSYVKHKS